MFRATLATIVVAVVDDAFVHPEPGTSAGGHLASGLVPAAIAVVAALAYPRLRPGLRGATALICGLLALTAGVVDGFRHVAVDRLGGDDLTAMPAGLAGIALLALGALTLWRTRRLDERPLRRYGRRTLVGIAAVVVGFLVVFPTAFAINATHRARTVVEAADLGRPYERVSFTTADGLRLVGWYVPSRNGAAVIVVQRPDIDAARIGGLVAAAGPAPPCWSGAGEIGRGDVARPERGCVRVGGADVVPAAGADHLMQQMQDHPGHANSRCSTTT